MTPAMKAVNAAIYLAMALPILPLAVGWRGVLRASSPRSKAELFGFSLASLSFLWLLAILAFRPVIAPAYSRLRFNTICANVGAAVVALVVGAFWGAKARAPLLTASALLLVLWVYLGVVSSVV
jgi:hypothetical protein